MRYYPQVKKAIGASEKIFEYLDRKPQVPPDGTLAPENLQGRIQFKNVTFSYNGSEKNLVLKVCIDLSCAFIIFEVFLITKASLPPERLSGGEAGSDHGPRGAQQIRKVHLREAAGEVLPAYGRGDPAGRRTAAALQRPVLT